MTKARTGRDGWRDGKGQIGIDGNKDADFGKMRRGNDPWSVEPRSATEGAPGDGVRRVDRVTAAGRGAYVNEDRILRNKLPDEDPQQGTTRRGGGKDIFDNVERNSGDVSESGGTGPIRYGVD
jgi:hypothetical protein